MFDVEVFPNSVENRVSRKTGNPYAKQKIWVQLPGSPYPVEWEVFPPKGSEYPPGKYRIKKEAFKIQGGNFECAPFDTLEPRTDDAKKAVNG